MYTHWRLPVKLDLMLHIGQKAHEPDITLHTLRYKVKKKKCNPREPFTMSKLPKTARRLLEGREASVLQSVTATEVTAEN